ncbi:coproporphyrinogen III oxidase family protein [Longilinea arvoryzae]|uniref:coproporphyrinogen III oxidase family protein n=1 Tax=Longilinea arvoryzae TaxID=360412 RepID=UPI001F26DDF6|nr:coproporphyrinogen III oxidase family protein [Longilinea arvoryzae]
MALVLKNATREYLKLKPAQIDVLPGPRPGHKYVLYAHVPFCESLCPYCSFNRFLFQEDRTRTYFKNLRDEMRLVAGLGYHFESLYFGGGTPTILIDELVETIDLAKELFGIQEVSCETNPNHLTPEILNQLQGRVDRLSVGVQSFDDGLLKQMSRLSKFGSGDEILKRIQNSIGILPSINVDMIFNFPSQTEEILRADIRKVIESGANQVTFYPLMSSPSVSFAMDRAIGKVDYSREQAYYKIVNEELGAAYRPMSAWTYSRQDTRMIDEYIVEYEEYVGIGSGSFSYLDGELFVNTFSLGEYDRLVSSGRMGLSASRRFDTHQQMQYRFMMELFDLKLNKNQFKKDFNGSLEGSLWIEMLFMRLMGAFQKGTNKDLVRLRRDSSYLMVVMMREFFAGVNVLRDQARQALAPNERLMCLVNEKVIS